MRENFSDYLGQLQWETVERALESKTSADVERALHRRGPLSIEDFQALISPAAAPYLEIMARRSREITLRRFGKTIQLYIPLYLSNECTNHCVYCGFSMENEMPRRTLGEREILDEVTVIRQWGFEHVLLVTGEDVRHADVDYLCQAVRLLRPLFAQISLEVQPLEQEEYERLIRAGVTAVYVYQETYRKERWKEYHKKGKKTVFDYRLNTPDRLGRAGIRKIGLGCLIGLESWRVDSVFLAHHLRYLEQRYWKTRYSISFPRLRPHAGDFQPREMQSDRELAQLIFAWRIFDPDVELSLSTRESPEFRDGLIGLGITHMSAASRTDPGGYADSASSTLEQFAIHDNRTAAEVARAISRKGCEPVWKDWDMVLELFGDINSKT